MRFLLLLFFLLISCVKSVIAQDTLFKINGEVLLVEVIDIYDKEIKYLDKTDSLNVFSSIISKALVEKIYIAENGDYLVFSKNMPLFQKPVKTNNEWLQQGNRDAALYYQGFGTSACVTGVTSTYYPVLGLIAALATSSTEPRIQNLGIPDRDLIKNAYYVAGYTQQARKIKKRKIWTSFGVGTGMFIGLAVISASLAK